MCGIVGLFLKDPALEPELGRLTAGMLATMSDRGPDSAGFAVYGAGEAGQTKLTLRGPSATAIEETVAEIEDAFPGAQSTLHDTHAVVALPDQEVEALVKWLEREAPDTEIVGRGKRMEIFKEVGLPERGRAVRACRHERHARHRPYPHGDGVRGDHGRRPSLLDRQGPVPRA